VRCSEEEYGGRKVQKVFIECLVFTLQQHLWYHYVSVLGVSLGGVEPGNIKA